MARSLGTPAGWEREAGDSAGEVGRDSGEHQPHFCYTPPVVFFSFVGDCSRVRAAIARGGVLDTSTVEGVKESNAKWTVRLAGQGRQDKQIGKKRARDEMHPWKKQETRHDKSKLFKTFDSSPSSMVNSCTLIAVNLEKPENLGSIYRNMACFGVEKLTHVFKSADPPIWNDKFRFPAIKSLGRGCHKYAKRELIRIENYLSSLRSSLPPSDQRSNRKAEAKEAKSNESIPSRPPIVAIETATSAVSIASFKFPPVCSIMVGSEGRGIDQRILAALHPGYDSIVYIPMYGPHHSLNVAMAVGIALFEYRRQNPPGW